MLITSIFLLIRHRLYTSVYTLEGNYYSKLSNLEKYILRKFNTTYLKDRMYGNVIVAVVIIIMAIMLLQFYLKKSPISQKGINVLFDLNIIISFVGSIMSIMVFLGKNTQTRGYALRYDFIILTVAIIVFSVLLKKINPNEQTGGGLKSNGELFDGFKKIEDDMSGAIMYVHPQSYKIKHRRQDLDFEISFDKPEGFEKYIIILYFYYRYYDEWMFVEEITFKTDNNRYIIEVDTSRENDVIRDSNGGVRSVLEEWDTYIINTPKDIEMFKDLATTNNLKIRISGEKYYKDYEYNGKSRRKIVDAYSALKNATEKISVEEGDLT